MRDHLWLLKVVDLQLDSDFLEETKRSSSTMKPAKSLNVEEGLESFTPVTELSLIDSVSEIDMQTEHFNQECTNVRIRSGTQQSGENTQQNRILSSNIETAISNSEGISKFSLT